MARCVKSSVQKYTDLKRYFKGGGMPIALLVLVLARTAGTGIVFDDAEEEPTDDDESKLSLLVALSSPSSSSPSSTLS